MRKRLTFVGNSLGLVIERPILDLLNITKDTELEVTTDGRRLIIEPAASQNEAPTLPASIQPDNRSPVDDHPDAREFADPQRTIELLDQLVRLKMDNDRFRKLHHAQNYRNTITAHRSYCTMLVERRASFRVGETNAVTAQRLSWCLDQLRAGQSWEVAIAEALRRFPK
jgi:antitoxin MazE